MSDRTMSHMRAIDFHVHLPTPDWLDGSMGGYVEAAEAYFRSKVERQSLDELVEPGHRLPPRDRDRGRLREPPGHPQPVQRLAAQPVYVSGPVDEQIPRDRPGWTAAPAT